MVKRYCNLCGRYLRYPEVIYNNKHKLYLCDKCIERIRQKVMDRKCKTCGHIFLYPIGDICGYCLDICESCGSSDWEIESGLKVCKDCKKQILETKYRKVLKKTEDKQRRIILD